MQIAKMAQARDSTPMPPHDVVDHAKLADLITSMQQHGWVGTPLVTHGEQALTGSHRIAAAVVALVGDTADADVAIPCIEVRDLCSAYSLDWDELLADNHGDWYMAGCELIDLLPADVVDELGLDLH